MYSSSTDVSAGNYSPAIEDIDILEANIPTTVERLSYVEKKPYDIDIQKDNHIAATVEKDAQTLCAEADLYIKEHKLSIPKTYQSSNQKAKNKVVINSVIDTLDSIQNTLETYAQKQELK